MFALFYEKGNFGTDYILRTGDVIAIRNQLAYINDWMCLVQNGRSMGTKKDQPKLDELEKFLNTCEDRKTLENFKLKISTGELGCIMCSDTVSELKEMKDFLLSIPKFLKEYPDKINGLFDKIIASIDSGGNSQQLFNKISSKQYIDSGIGRDDFLD